MKLIATTVLSLFVLGLNAQINLNTKNLKKIKKVAEVVTEKEIEPAKAPKKEANESQNTNSNTGSTSNSSSSMMSTSTSSSSYPLHGWTKEEFSDIGFTNTYFLGGGWIVDEIEARPQFNDELKVPVVNVKYESSCYNEPFFLSVFKMADKGAVGGYDFETAATKSHPNGRYKSELVIVDHDKYIMVFSYFSKIDADMDKYMEEKLPELQRRLPNEW